MSMSRKIVKQEYDDHGNCTYYENSDGEQIGIPIAEVEQGNK